MDILFWIQTGLTIIGGATVLFKSIVTITKNKVDDEVLAFIVKVLEKVSLNHDTGKLEIDVKSK